MLSSHGALMHLESEIRKWGEIAGRLRTEAGVAYDALVNDPELAF